MTDRMARNIRKDRVEPAIPVRILPSVAPAELTPRQVARELSILLDDGAELVTVGEGKEDPARLLNGGYRPKHKIELFDTLFYLTSAREIPELRFMVAYIVQRHVRTGRVQVHPRIFYKDLSLIWRCASHLVQSDDELWIGKGDVGSVVEDGEETVFSVESTTDLPLEMQTAMEVVSHKTHAARGDHDALGLVLRRAPNDRIEPYQDFTAPRRRAASDPRNRINRGRSVARFARKNDPTSLQFVAGFEPDFSHGIIETSTTRSAFYGGEIQRYRILSCNRQIQYLFIAGPAHVWIIPPQALTTELSSFGVRTVDVVADENLFVPGYEYHYLDEEQEPAEMFSQIPEGFAGEPNEHDEARADASAWLDSLPVVREFRQKVLGGRKRRRAASLPHFPGD
jgi:hypothetical protein